MLRKASEDLTGETFGLWEVLGRARPGANRAPRWKCRCACGAEHDVSSTSLRAGRSKGCWPCRNRSRENTGGGANLKEMAGLIFGSWTVLPEPHEKRRTGAYWLCECACGNRKYVRGGDLRAGRSSMCKPCAGRVRKP